MNGGTCTRHPTGKGPIVRNHDQADCVACIHTFHVQEVDIQSFLIARVETTFLQKGALS